MLKSEDGSFIARNMLSKMRVPNQRIGLEELINTGEGNVAAISKSDDDAIKISPVTLGKGALIQSSSGHLYSVAIVK